MSRKLYALFILVWAVWSLVLVYLYFFVYYTSTLIIESNVPEYKVELFSKSTAQKWEYDCPEMKCQIDKIAPFEYNVTVYKDEYEPQFFTLKVKARRKESLFIELDKKADLVHLEKIEVSETAKEKIERLREQNLYYASFSLSNDAKIIFKESADTRITLNYESWDTSREIQSFEKVPSESIHVSSIGDSWDIFLKIGGKQYIYKVEVGSIKLLPYAIEILYIKPWLSGGKYVIVTENGSFLYDIVSGEGEFYYLFKDFVYLSDNEVIGIIENSEKQKKKNFGIEEKGNVIVKYNIENKERKIILQNTPKIDTIIWKGESIVFSSGDSEYELVNY